MLTVYNVLKIIRNIFKTLKFFSSVKNFETLFKGNLQNLTPMYTISRKGIHAHLGTYFVYFFLNAVKRLQDFLTRWSFPLRIVFTFGISFQQRYSKKKIEMKIFHFMFIFPDIPVHLWRRKQVKKILTVKPTRNWGTFLLWFYNTSKNRRVFRF